MTPLPRACFLTVAWMSWAIGSFGADGWKRVEADNGAAYQVNVGNMMQLSNGWVGVAVYADEGRAQDKAAQRVYYFNCKGRMQEIGGGGSTYIPPRSVGAAIERAVCGRSTNRSARE